MTTTARHKSHSQAAEHLAHRWNLSAEFGGDRCRFLAGFFEVREDLRDLTPRNAAEILAGDVCRQTEFALHVVPIKLARHRTAGDLRDVTQQKRLDVRRSARRGQSAGP